ncbi:MAG: hypothetical protein PHZ04_01280 [Patescibacteria group bacterium]|nr:hypothetical protein [Patescibacteria group bacterium]MDD5294622.1 hypothetical protein [Patescibacteria group bacterium]MDD5554390.1 hypothetical protein [Patescibacteria group bacterium]
MKKIIFIILVLIIVGAGGWYFFASHKEQARLEDLKQQYPKLANYIDDVIEKQANLEEDKNDIERYTTLGLAWKSLADWAKQAGIADYASYYQKALDIYEQGIKKTSRRNTLLMTNAGNMAKYLGDYKLAENYYKEAISVSPGDETYYSLLADLYEYEMGKTKEEIIAVYDEGLKHVLNTGWLTAGKEAYLGRAESGE